MARVSGQSQRRGLREEALYDRQRRKTEDILMEGIVKRRRVECWEVQSSHFYARKHITFNTFSINMLLHLCRVIAI